MREMMRTTRLLVLTLIVCAAARGAQAQCSWFALPTPINFGVYSVFGGGSNSTTTSGTVRCIGARDFEVSSTTGSSGTYTPRRMSGTAQYNIFVDPGRTFIWGNNTGGTIVYAATSGGGTTSYSGSAYGNVPGGQDLAPGAYSDSITAILRHRPAGGGAWTTLPGVAIPISMTVSAECRINTFNLTFGAYNPFTVTALPQSTTVNIYCTRSTPATFSLNNGANFLGVQKRMRSGATANYLDYTATLASGSGTATSSLVPIGNGIPLNGSIPAAQDATVGAYQDTLQVTVNY